MTSVGNQSMPIMQVAPHHDAMHPLTDASNHNESVYFNLYDRPQNIGCFLRLGNRPNEGHAELTVAVYLGDQRTAFYFSRPKIDGNQGFDAGGMSVDFIDPLRELQVRYDGPLLMLAHPSDLDDPARCFRDSPRENAELSITFWATAEAWGGELDRNHDDVVPELLDAFWTGHYEQPMSGEGTLRIGKTTYSLSGLGIRDHSWGPRTWQSIHWYRWLTGNFTPDRSFVVSVIGSRSGENRYGGFLQIDGQYLPVESLEVETVWHPDRHEPAAVTLAVTTARGTERITGTVPVVLPLRHRKLTEQGEEVTRIAEGMTTWVWDDHTGYGLSEYLDAVADGRPVGTA
jgi:hypothetical protein